jgi:hypothetical protein
MRQWHERLRLGIGIALVLAVGACSEGRWQSDARSDTTPRRVKVVSASTLVVPSARFVLVNFDAGQAGRFGLGLKRDENLVRARVVLRLADRDGEQDCSFEAACRALYMEESDIASGLIPLRMRGTVTLESGWRGRHLSARLRIVPKDENDQSQRYVGTGGSFLNLDLKDVKIVEDPQMVAEMRSWREMGGSSRLREWQDEVTGASAPKP